MLSVVEKSYSKTGLKDIGEWGFGRNWPVVYIIYNKTKAYVGETIDAVRRTEQHLQEHEFAEFTGFSICLISSSTLLRMLRKLSHGIMSVQNKHGRQNDLKMM